MRKQLCMLSLDSSPLAVSHENTEQLQVAELAGRKSRGSTACFLRINIGHDLLHYVALLQYACGLTTSCESGLRKRVKKECIGCF